MPVFGVPWDLRKQRASIFRLAVSVWPLKRVIVIFMKFSRFQLFLVTLVAHLLPLVAFDACVALVALANRKWMTSDDLAAQLAFGVNEQLGYQETDSSPQSVKRQATDKRCRSWWCELWGEGECSVCAEYNYPLVWLGRLVKLKVSGQPCTALLDSGSQVRIIFEPWYQKYLPDIPIHPVSGFALWGLSESSSSYPYRGYVLVDL